MANHIHAQSGWSFVMLDLAYVALGLGGLFLMVLYARVLDRL
ncbi:hypothetical protein [Labrys sp. KNU-23]|nr:hypothetical protein [Labrys sp. KNU-23]